MSLPRPKENRFPLPERERPAPSAEGAAPFLDVEGAVVFDGEQPREVTVFGVIHAFRADGHVEIAGRVYQLLTVDGRRCLGVVGATHAQPHR